MVNIAGDVEGFWVHSGLQFGDMVSSLETTALEMVLVAVCCFMNWARNDSTVSQNLKDGDTLRREAVYRKQTGVALPFS